MGRADSTEKDREEVERKKIQYKDYMEWKDRGILKDLKDYHGIDNPTRELLVTIAMLMGNECGIRPDRQDKRRRDLMIGWLNLHYEQIRAIVPNIVLRDTKGPMTGPNMDFWNVFRRDNPEHKAVQDFERACAGEE
jgi:hypothetical protein